MSNPIHLVEKDSHPSPDEKNTEHIETSPNDPGWRIESPSEEWQEPTAKLNLQMALAFLVSASL